jgi:hypothetical protein
MIGMESAFAFSATSPTTYVAIPNLVEFNIPQKVSARVEKTVYSRTSRLRRYEPGLDDVADQSFTVLQDMSNATHKLLRGYKASRTLLWFRAEVATNDAATLFVGFEWQGRISDFKPAQPKDGEQTTQYSIQFDGEDVYEDGAPGATQIT